MTIIIYVGIFVYVYIVANLQPSTSTKVTHVFRKMRFKDVRSGYVFSSFDKLW